MAQAKVDADFEAPHHSLSLTHGKDWISKLEETWILSLITRVIVVEANFGRCFWLGARGYRLSCFEARYSGRGQLIHRTSAVEYTECAFPSLQIKNQYEKWK